MSAFRALSRGQWQGQLLLRPVSIPPRLQCRQYRYPRGLHSPPCSPQYISASAFTPLVPPTSALPKIPPRASSTSPTRPRRLRKTTNTFLTLLTLSLITYLLDTHLNYSALTRSVRTLSTALLISLDYQLNFTSHKSQHQLSSLHSRNADRLVHLCLTNGGLYQKIGQAIAMQSALLPREFQAKFARFFSDTPQASRSEIEGVLREEFPHLRDPVNMLFVPGTFTNRAMGSASVAQVHKAQLNDGSGAWVAVKIQKPGISRQVGWDLAVFKFAMMVFSERMFGLPLGFLVPYICERLESETDFSIELKNSARMRRLVEENFDRGKVPGRAGGWFIGMGGEKGRVYVPRVYEDLSTKRVMVAEWIDGVTLSQGRRGAFKDQQISPKVVMDSLLKLFARQMFWWGEVHCDPHPGNILVRKVSVGEGEKGGKMATEVVLLDHGLYVHLHPDLRRQYSRLWTALMSLDTSTIGEITQEWGFGNAEMLASMTMLRPYRGSIGGAGEAGEGLKKELTPYERQLLFKNTLRASLLHEELIPRELIFLGRCMRILQANNQLLGSPVNRLNILALSASESLLPRNPNYWRPPGMGVAGLVKSYLHYTIFRITLILLDLGFLWVRARSWVAGGGGRGFEEEIEERMKSFAREEWGLEIGGGVFRG
ncbi:ABC1 domain protein [Tirmania nivea]|nr:ABC1 domain protein [Tirmania nivea]